MACLKFGCRNRQEVECSSLHFTVFAQFGYRFLVAILLEHLHASSILILKLELLSSIVSRVIAAIAVKMPDDAWAELLAVLASANDDSKFCDFRIIPTTYKQLGDESKISAHLLLPRRISEDSTKTIAPLPLIVRIHGGYLVSQCRSSILGHAILRLLLTGRWQ